MGEKGRERGGEDGEHFTDSPVFARQIVHSIRQDILHDAGSDLYLLLRGEVFHHHGVQAEAGVAPLGAQ